ncbi:MAG: RNA 2',3'-cyclic phosphodiesterase [Rhodospirillaceae bacterium]|nr:RNA 2',3'-cyclic phosphodiesterase [Rhodospirillaceae bacterium]
MIRLFVGLSVPEDIAEELADLADNMPGARWIEPQNMHVTLRFIGEVSETVAEDIHHELARVTSKPFAYEGLGLETFGQGFKAHALIMRVSLTPELEILQGRVESAVARTGQPREARKFKPHITLARLKDSNPDRVQQFIAAHNLFRAGPVGVDHFILYESKMGKSGSAYFPLAEYPIS